MAKFAVSAHRTEWFVEKDRGRIRLKFDGVKEVKTVIPTSPTEYLAMVMMLHSHKRVLYDSKTKILSTSW